MNFKYPPLGTCELVRKARAEWRQTEKATIPVIDNVEAEARYRACVRLEETRSAVYELQQHCERLLKRLDFIDNDLVNTTAGTDLGTLNSCGEVLGKAADVDKLVARWSDCAEAARLLASIEREQCEACKRRGQRLDRNNLCLECASLRAQPGEPA